MSSVKNNIQNDVSNFICEYGYGSYKTQKKQTAHPIPTVLDAALLKVTMTQPFLENRMLLSAHQWITYNFFAIDFKV